ncbi:MAG: DNA-binding response regulator [Alicyclobacillus sp. RIFOXYA1_FULL_53_8]|nr:MAG: DNA-binding response regulator [Alicyclobacillus sp. RIFOXYA1_FULL_53_8]
MRVLIVEDEHKLAEALVRLLTQEGFQADIANTVFAGIEAAMSNAYDCLLVDVMLPDGDGMQLVAELRKLEFFTPVLMLTARNATSDRVRGLNAGADDYLGKPFEWSELLARIKALVRRSAGQHEVDELAFGRAKLHRNSRSLEVDEKILELSSKEFMLLEYFFRHPKQVLTREQLVSHVWGPDAEVADNSLDTYIYFLRKKCTNLGLKQVLKTVRGQGYMLGSQG